MKLNYRNKKPTHTSAKCKVCVGFLFRLCALVINHGKTCNDQKKETTTPEDEDALIFHITARKFGNGIGFTLKIIFDGETRAQAPTTNEHRQNADNHVNSRYSRHKYQPLRLISHQPYYNTVDRNFKRSQNQRLTSRCWLHRSRLFRPTTCPRLEPSFRILPW